MLRSLLLVGALLAAAVAGIAAVDPGEPEAVEDAPGFHAHADPDQDAPAAAPSSLEVDASGVAPTGWTVVPVHADERVRLRVASNLSVKAHEAPGAAGGAAFVAHVDEEGTPQVHGGGTLTTGSRDLALAHEGREVGCCAATASGPDLGGRNATVTVWAGPDEPAYLGAVLANTTDETRVTFTVEPSRNLGGENVSIYKGAPASGPQARAVDLVERAYREGTTVRAQHEVLGAPGTANVTLDAKRSAFTYLDVDAEPNAEATLRLELANGIAFPDLLPDQDPAEHLALSGPGSAHASLSELENPGRETTDDRPGEVHATLLLADVELPLEAADHERAPEGDLGTDRFGRTDIRLDGDLMPTSTGWFLVPVLAEEPASVHVKVRPRLDDTGDPKFAVPIVAQHDALRFPRLQTAGHEASDGVHAAGTSVECCEDVSEDGRNGRAELGGWFGTGPDTPLYLGLVAANWSEDDEVELRASSPGADLEAGPVRTGAAVEAVNLFEAAREDPSARVGGEPVLGGYEDVHQRWQARDNGLVAVSWDLEEARGELALTMPNGSTVDLGSNGTAGAFTGLGGVGTAELSFTDPERPDGEAFALFADLDLPYEGSAWREQ